MTIKLIQHLSKILSHKNKRNLMFMVAGFIAGLLYFCVSNDLLMVTTQCDLSLKCLSNDSATVELYTTTLKENTCC